jgi:glycosyltransferase involved in cell wall biosynthesis
MLEVLDSYQWVKRIGRNTVSMSKKRWFKLRTVGTGKKNAPVRLSQCMIVKNEEKNIERALTWGKNIICEQIVVDTGSTDRTVEIAESMGAKVFHFEWINDFAAAKNFALSKAKGNWVAFLDADEYLSDEGALHLFEMLGRMQAPTGGIMLLLPIVNLKDDGQAGSVVPQERVFSNPAFKYVGAIHEHLAPVKAGVNYVPVRCNDINIFHTGYTTAAYTETNKLERNIEMLRHELELKPDDPDAMAYLADALLVRNSSRSDLREARQLYTQSLLGEKSMSGSIKMNSYPKFLLLSRKTDLDLFYRVAEHAVNDFPTIGTFNLNYGVALYLKGDYDRSWEYLRKAEDFLKSNNVMVVQDMLYHTVMLFAYLLKCAEARNDKQAMIRYAVLTLREDKSQIGVLGPLIGMFQQNGTDDDAILDVLGKIYNFENPKDVITAAQGAEAAGAEELMNRLKEMANSLVNVLA